MHQPTFEVTFDKKSRAAYLRFSHEKIAETVEHADGALLFDLDQRGKLVGIEVLAAGTLRVLFQTQAQPRVEMPPPAYFPRLQEREVEGIERLFEMSA